VGGGIERLRRPKMFKPIIGLIIRKKGSTLQFEIVRINDLTVTVKWVGEEHKSNILKTRLPEYEPVKA
jgi:hypothetical protein